MQELARAKVNLSLHITGKRSDGFHLLDSIVVFPEIGDVLHLGGEGLSISGPFGHGLPVAGNLVTRAAELLGVAANITLEKNLPVASGIGGGSADAAAALRLLARHFQKPLPDGASLGADVLACLVSKPLRMQGIGEQITLLPPLPKFAILLVNSGAPVSTPEVFGALKSVENTKSPALPVVQTQHEFFSFIAAQRNDMQEAALRICPSIAEVLAALTALPNCRLSRMSGSGGTCFGLFNTAAQAEQAAEEINRNNPDWWVAAARV